MTYPIAAPPSKETESRLELVEAAADPLPERQSEPPRVASPVTVPAPRAAVSRRFWTLGVAATALILAAALGRYGWHTQGRPFDERPERSSFDLPPGWVMADSFGPSVAISANGKVVAFVASPPTGPRSLYYRRFSDGVNQKMPGTEGAADVFLSPDGERIAYRHDGWLIASTLDGQTRKRLEQVGTNIPEAGLWTAHDEIYFTAASRRGNNRLVTSLWKIKFNQPDRLEELSSLLDSESGLMEWHTNIRELPTGDLLITALRGAAREIWTVNKSFSERKLLINGAGGHYSPTGHLLYYRGTTLYAAPFDLSRRELTGPEAVIQTHVGSASWSGANMAVSSDGSLVFTQRGKMVADRRLIWVALDGKETPIPVPPGPYAPTDLSPDGQSALVARYEDVEAQWGLWMMPLGPGEWKKISDGHPIDVAGVFAGANTVLFNRMGTGLMRRRLNSYSSEECIAPELDFTRYPSPFAPGQQEILFAEGYRPIIETILYSLPLGPKPGPPRQVSRGDYGVRLSPDLRWVASVREGKAAVQRFPINEANTVLVAGPGYPPVWDPGGRTLYFVNSRREMVAVPFHPDSPPRFGAVRVLFNAARYHAGTKWHSTYPLRRDGRAFLMARNEDTSPEGPATAIQVVHNWFTEVKRLAHPGLR